MSWLGGWKYRKKVELSRASGAVTNYQMKVLVGESSGATGEDVDCGGLCASDFDDLRFTAANGTTLLDYWIESVSGATPNQLATVWIEFDSIGTGATTFYMYYGNAGAAAASNGENTFPFFDHFAGSSLDSSKWDTYGTPTVTVSSSIVKVLVTGSAWESIYAKTTSTPPYAWEARLRGNSADGWAHPIGGVGHETDQGVTTGIFSGTFYYATANGGQGSWSGAGSYTADAWWRVSVRLSDSTHSTAIWFKESTSETRTGTKTFSAAVTANKVGIGDYYNDDYVEADFILARNFVSTEPAWGSWGVEEVEEIYDLAGVADSADAFSLTDSISDAAGIGDSADAYNTDSPIADGFGVADVVDASGDWSVSDSDVAGIGDTADAGFEAEGWFTDTSGLGDSSDGFNYTAWAAANRDRAIVRYYCTLTGAPDGLTDLTVPISSFQATKRTGESTYLSVVVPGMTYAEQIADRSNGELVIYMAYLLDGVESLREEILRVELEQINPQEGARSRSITLIGHKTVTYDARAVSIQGCNYKYTSGGSRGFRFPQADPYLNPGDALTVVDTDDALTVDYITYAISARGAKFMEVRE